MKQIFVCAGEASGDLHASALIHALQSRRPDLEFFGLGGELMAAVGVELLYNLHDLAVTGFWEVAKRFGHFRKVYRRTLREIDARRPDLILLVDYPGFNLRLATNLKRQGYKIAYFILPQVWAWKPARIRRLEENADLLLAILPFEPPLFDPSMVRCEFVGHPLLDLINSNSGDNAFKRKNSIAENQRIIALLPGSREVEINRHYLVMLEVIKAISAEFADIVPVTLVRNEIDTVLYRAIEQKSGVTSHHCQRDRYGLLRAAECSLVASGTATLEAALCGRPFCVVYKTAPLTYLVARRLINLKMVGLANIVAGKQVVPEYLQSDMNQENLAGFCRQMLTNESSQQEMISALAKIRQRLGEPGAATRAAEMILSEFA